MILIVIDSVRQRYRTPSRSPSRSPTPPHWRYEQRRTISMKEFEVKDTRQLDCRKSFWGNG